MIFSLGSFLKKARLWKVFFFLVQSCMAMAAAWILSFFLVVLCEMIFPFPLWGRVMLLIISFSLSVTVFIHFFFPLNRYSLITLSLELPLESHKKDDLRVAWELERTFAIQDDTSDSLKKKFCDEMRVKCERLSLPKVILPAGLLRTFVAGALCCVLAVFAFAFPGSPFHAPAGRLFSLQGHQAILQFLSIVPGHASLPWGSQVEVKITEITKETASVYLKARRRGRREWESIGVWDTDHQTTSFRLAALQNEIEYQVFWRNLKSQVYRISPVTLPQLGHFEIRIKPPKYTGLDVKTLTGHPSVTVLAGSRVSIRAESSAPIRSAQLLYSDGRSETIKVQKEKNISIELTALHDEEYWFDLTSPKNDLSDPHPPHYQIHVLKDDVPQIDILSPDQDLMASPDDKIPFTYEYSDQFGVFSIYLVYQIDDQPVRREQVKQFKSRTQSGLEGYTWSLAGLRLGGGEIIQCHFEAEDNNDMTGPGTGMSRNLIIEIVSYRKEHQAIEKALEEFREELLDALGDQILVKEGLTEEEKSWEKILELQEKVAASLDSARENLQDLLPRMERDPLGDYRMWNEHRYMEEALSDLLSGSVNRSLESIEKGDASKAQSNAEETIAELERMALLSEDLQKNQRMSDLLDSAHSLEDKAEALTEGLEAIEHDPEKMAELSKLMDDVSKLLSEISQKMLENSEDLPEEFINQESVKSINLNEMQNAAQDVQSALAAGDMKEALKRARALMSQIQNMMEALESGRQNAESAAGDLNDISEKVGEKSRELEKIIEEQKKLIKQTEALENKRIQEMLKKQEQLLKDLARRQELVMKATKEVFKNAESSVREPEYFPKYRSYIQSTLPHMANVLEEFRASRIESSLEWLDVILKYLDQAIQSTHFSVSYSTTSGQGAVLETMVSTSSLKIKHLPDHVDSKIKRVLDIREKTAWVRKEEKDILEELLKNQEETSKGQASWTDEERKSFQSLSQQQGSVGKKTLQLRQDIQKLGRRTSILGSKIPSLLGGAAEDMNSAQQSLGDKSSRPALESERSALQKLSQGDEGMKSAMKALKMMQGKAGRPMMGSLQPRSGTGGSYGTAIKPIHIPTPEEYKPPRAFREEILESLKEKYPKNHEKIIRDYFKRLTE